MNLGPVIRVFKRNPWRSLVSVLTLSVGMASVGIAFAVVETVILRPLPFAQSDRIMTISQRIPMLGSSPSVNTADEFLTWKKTGLFESAAILETDESTVEDTFGINSQPERIYGASVTSDFFNVFGVRPILGRGFLPEDVAPQREDVIVLSHQLWARRFASDRNIIGKTLLLSDKRVTVIGVMPPRFDFPRLLDIGSIMGWAPEQAEYWTPFVITPQILQEGNFNYYMLGRLRPGVTRSRASAELLAAAVRLFRQQEQKYPQYKSILEQMLASLVIYVTPLQESISQPVHDVLWMVLAAVALLLVLVLFNLGALLLTKNAEREGEYALRQALGASRWALFRQSFMEEAALTALASIAALLFADWGLAAVRAIAADKIPRIYDLKLDGLVICLILGAAMLTSLLFGLLSQVVFGSRRPGISLHSQNRSSTNSRRTAGLKSAFLIGELAVSFVLLTGAGLLLQSFRNAVRENPGFNPDHVLTLKVFFNPRKTETAEKRLGHMEQVLEELRRVPAIESASLISRLPLTGDQEIHSVKRAGEPFARSPEDISAEYRVIEAEYFHTMQIPLIAGRMLRAGDNPTQTVINQAMAQHLWRDQYPIGKQLIDGDNPPLTVVGVVGNVHNGALEKPVVMQFYRLLAANPYYANTFVIRTAADPLALIPRIQKTITRLDPAEPIASQQTMEHLVGAVTLQRRFETGLLSALSVMALFLTALGLFSIVSVSVAYRTREFGIRLALGATASQIVTRELIRTAGIVVVGLLAGLVLALTSGRLVAGLLYQVTPWDARFYALAMAIIAMSAIVASWIPAWRSGHVDPSNALRGE